MKTSLTLDLLATALAGALTPAPSALLAQAPKYAANGPDSGIRCGVTFLLPK